MKFKGTLQGVCCRSRNMKSSTVMKQTGTAIWRETTCAALIFWTVNAVPYYFLVWFLPVLSSLSEFINSNNL